MTIHFQIHHPGELAAGIRSYTERVSITVESGDPGGIRGDFSEHIKDALADWFDGATVTEEGAAAAEPQVKPEPDYSELYEHH